MPGIDISHYGSQLLTARSVHDEALDRDQWSGKELLWKNATMFALGQRGWEQRYCRQGQGLKRGYSRTGTGTSWTFEMNM